MESEEEPSTAARAASPRPGTWALPVTVHDHRPAAGRAGTRSDCRRGPRRSGDLWRASGALRRSLATSSVLPRPLDRRSLCWRIADPLVLAGMLGILQARRVRAARPAPSRGKLAWWRGTRPVKVVVAQQQHLTRAEGLGLRYVLCLEDAAPSGPAWSARNVARSRPCRLHLGLHRPSEGCRSREPGTNAPLGHRPLELGGTPGAAEPLGSASTSASSSIDRFLAGGTLVFGRLRETPWLRARSCARASARCTRHPPSPTELAAAAVVLESSGPSPRQRR